MKTVEASEVVAMVKNGAKVFIGRNFTGQPKIKIVRGPFGLFVSRYNIDEQECEILKSKLDQQHN
jgi:hypothetical protein